MNKRSFTPVHRRRGFSFVLVSLAQIFAFNVAAIENDPFWRTISFEKSSLKENPDESSKVGKQRLTRAEITLAPTRENTLVGSQKEDSSANNNKLNLTADQHSNIKFVFGGISQSTSPNSFSNAANYNKLTLNEGTHTYYSVSAMAALGKVGNNTVDILQGAKTEKTIGGFSAGGEAYCNTINVRGKAFITLSGAGLTADANKLTISRTGEIEELAIGAYGQENVASTEIQSSGKVNLLFGALTNQTAAENLIYLKQWSSTGSAVAAYLMAEKSNLIGYSNLVQANYASVSGSLIGMYSEGSGTFGDNTVILEEKNEVGENLIGAAARGASFFVSNQVNVKGFSSVKGSVFGSLMILGSSPSGVGGALLRDSRVDLSDSTVEKDVINGYSAFSANTVYNSITIKDSFVGGSVCGNIGASGSNFGNNWIDIIGPRDGTTIGGNLVGIATIEASGSQNTIIQENYIKASGKYLIQGNVLGVHGDTLSTIERNFISLSGDGRVEGDLLSVISNSQQIKDNHVIISGKTEVLGDVYGPGHFSQNSHEFIKTGTNNTLNLRGTVSTGAVKGFDALNFFVEGSNKVWPLPFDEAKDKFVLTVNSDESLDFSKTPINVFNVVGKGETEAKDPENAYGLMQIIAKDKYLTGKVGIKLGEVVKHGTFTDTVWKVNQTTRHVWLSGKDLVIDSVPPATLLPTLPTVPGTNPNPDSTPDTSPAPDLPPGQDTSEPVDPVNPDNSTPPVEDQPEDPSVPSKPDQSPPSEEGSDDMKPSEEDNPSSTPSLTVKPEQVVANDNSRTLTETILSNILLINQGAEFVADQGLSAMKNSALNGKYLFAASEVGTNKYGHGREKIDLNGGSFITGSTAKVDGTLIGGFFEASWAHSSSKPLNASARSNLSAYGIGLLLNREFNENFSVDASFRIGQIKNEFTANYFDVQSKAKFTTRSLYTSAHLGANYEISVNEKISTVFYGRYSFSFIDKDNVKVGNNEGDKLKVKSTSSHNLLAGAKVRAQLNQNLFFEGGLGVQQTMGTKTRGEISGVRLHEYSGNGTSGIAEISLKAKPSVNSPWRFDIGAKGYAGERRGVMGNVRATYSF